MGFGLKRAHLQANAQGKIDDALLLCRAKKYSNAYYLAGYSVEIGLKACIAAQVSAETIPDRDFLKNILSHEYPRLVGLAGLASELKAEKEKDLAFAANWALVSEWSPDSRYETNDSMSTQVLIAAVADPNSGVFQWIKRYW